MRSPSADLDRQQQQQQQQGGRGSPPQWVVQPPSELTFSNSTGSKLECVASGSPPPTIEWFLEDQLIAHNLHGLRMAMPNGSLIFPAFK